MGYSEANDPKFSIPSILAVVAAIGSFFVGAFWGFLLALVAIVAAIVGIIVAVAPSRRGGIVSMFALFIGGLALIAAVIKALMWLF